MSSALHWEVIHAVYCKHYNHNYNYDYDYNCDYCNYAESSFGGLEFLTVR